MDQLEQDLFLLEGLAKEQKNAIDSIYKNNYRSIQKLILNNNGSEEDAADVFQEAIIVLYEKAMNPEFRLSCQIKTYLYSVAKRLWLKRLQLKQRFSALPDEIDGLTSEENSMESEIEIQNNFHLMEMAMSKLGEPCRSLIEAYYIEKKDMNEIAALFNYTNSDNAKTQKYKCMIRLKKLFFSAYKK